MSGVEAQFRLQLDRFVLDAALHAPSAKITALFGPSGSGKTTILRCIAGLERAHGNLTVDGEVWQDDKHFRPTHQRPIGYVFQEPSLFAHLSVRENLLYGWKRVPVAQRLVTVDGVVEWLGLRQLLDRRDPSALSGGEKQRVAIGRALLTSPRLLLMDEPLAALDNASKTAILAALQRLQRELALPVLYVSHALDEVARLADHVVLLEAGRVVAEGPLHATLARLDLPTAELEDTLSVLDATVAEHDDTYHQTRLSCAGGGLWVSRVQAPIGTSVRARVRAHDVALATEPPHQTSVSNVLSGRIVDLRDGDADAVLVRIDLDGAALLARITKRSRDRLKLHEGQAILAMVKSVAVLA